ncbi:MAG: hypothetical protein OXG38_10010 [Chloroflexi bacterium]|nr:hypothetical protein [Chloroflexota bacterium]
MPELYRSTFEIQEPIDQVAETARSWVLAANRFPGDVTASNGVWKADGQTLEIWAGECAGESAYEMQWAFPAKSSGDFWRIELQLAASGGPTIAEARVHRERISYAGDPDDRPIRLALVHELLGRFTCSRDGIPLRSSSSIVREEHSDAFCRQVLLDPRRSFPVVVVSQTDDGKTALDAGRLQRDLAGLSVVALLEVPASRRIATALGRGFACYGGAVRVYRPGLQVGDDSRRHHYTLFSRARSAAFGMALRAHVAELSAETGILRRCDEIADRVRLGERQLLAGQVSELTRALEEQRSVTQHQGVEATEVLRSQQEKIDELGAEIERLRQQVARQDAALDSAAKALAEAPEQEPSDDPTTVAEAAMLARVHCPHLDIFPSAETSAEESRYQNPNAVWRSLERLNQIAEGMANGGITEEVLIGALRARGLDVSTESIDTMQRRPGTRQFPDEKGQLFEMPMHVKLGGGSGQDNRCRIHFLWDPAIRRIRVGHVGRHLPTSQS